jgi:hypothetical protein
MSSPLAYFITWSCYAQRLHGDERGTVDRDANRVGHAFIVANAGRVEYEARRLKHPPTVLDDAMRQCVDRTIREHAAFRGWKPLAINVRTTHVHLVVANASDKRPEDVMGQFKSWCTRRLRESGLITPDREVWAFHGSTRWINTELSLAAAMDYVLNQQ